MADELERAIRQRDLGLLAEPRSRGVQPRKPGLLDLPGGVTERLALLNQFLNPVEAIGQSMRAGERMMSPNMGGYDRLAALGDMLSGVAGVAGPAVAAGRAGIPAATAIIEGLLGGSPTTQAAGDMARQFGVDEYGGVPLTRENAPLIAHHNLSPKGVQVASEIGGIPMPSMAISRADYPLTNFGDVTLLADPRMVTPSRNVGVWPTDVYTGRQPRGELQFTNQRAVLEAMKADPNFGHMRDVGRWLDSVSNFDSANEMMKTAQLGIKEGINPRGFDNMRDYLDEVRTKLGYSVYDEAGAMPGLEAYGGVERVIYPKDMFTPSGNRRKPVPYTLESVMDRMAKDKAYTAGSEGWDYGPGSFRAVVTPPFRSMSDITAARGSIWPSDQIKEVKDAFSEAYGSVLEDVNAAYRGSDWRRPGEEAMKELAAGRSASWFGDIPQQTRADVRALTETVRAMPTEYFEAKPRVAYRLGDFPAAIVPEGDTASAETLRSAGIRDVLTYGTPEERVALFRRFPNLLFSAGAAGVPIGLLSMQPNEEQY
jgi:hypothetical protein